MKRLVVLSGAGISAESGIRTFRDSGGLWEEYPVEEVATPEGWHKNPELVNRFYNERRRDLARVMPNAAHRIIGELESYYDVTVITQNVDDLHERGGSSHVLHLHGELTKACSEDRKRCVVDIGYRDIQYGERAADGHLLRPFIVWFGEDVPLMSTASEIVRTADILIIVGTSLNVYPAAYLAYDAPAHADLYLIDPNEVNAPSRKNITFIREKATIGMQMLKEKLVPCE